MLFQLRVGCLFGFWSNIEGNQIKPSTINQYMVSFQYTTGHVNSDELNCKNDRILWENSFFPAIVDDVFLCAPFIEIFWFCVSIRSLGWPEKPRDWNLDRANR